MIYERKISMGKIKNVELGKFIKQNREKKGISQRELAKSVNVANSVISILENGEIVQPSILLVCKLSKTLDIDFFDLLNLSNYDEIEIELLQQLFIYELLSINEELIKKYSTNGKIDLLKVEKAYNKKELSENDAVALFIKCLNITSATELFSTTISKV